MDPFNWRRNTKILSYVVLIIQAISMGNFFASPFDVFDQLHLEAAMQRIGPVLTVLLLFTLLISFECVKVLAALKLMHAVGSGISPKEAEELCSFFRIVAVVWLLWDIFESYIQGRFKKTILFHLVSFFVVTKFMNELRLSGPIAPNSMNKNNPGSVRPYHSSRGL